MSQYISDPDAIDTTTIELVVAELIDRPVLVDACKEIGVCPLALRRRMRNDSLVNELIEEAINVGSDVIEAEAYKLAMGEETQIKTFNGKPVKWINPETGRSETRTERIRSDRTLLTILKAFKPEKYGDKQEVTHKGGTGVLLIPQSEGQQAFEDMLAQIKKEAEAEDAAFEQGGLDAAAGQSATISTE